MAEPFIYGSVTSGIEAATVAWEELGWVPAWFSEINPFCKKVLAHHWPKVPNLGDMTKLLNKKIFIDAAIDLLVGGTPCQSFSLAGLRGGLADDRGNLALEFCRLLVAKRPRWFVWENVPGVFSSFSHEAEGDEPEVWETADFATLLLGFQECGYSCCWRVLDAKYYGVPQQRRRVFVVGHLGEDWRPPFAVLFEPEGLLGHPTSGRKAGQEIARTITTGTGVRSGSGQVCENLTLYEPMSALAENWAEQDVKSALRADASKSSHVIVATLDASYDRLQGASQQDLRHGHSHLVTGFDINMLRPDNRTKYGDIQPTLNTKTGAAVAYTVHGTDNTIKESKLHTALQCRPPGKIENNSTTIIQVGNFVRRLTPLECERLQGFPDNHTNIPGAADSPRYRSIGNSMAVPVMNRIGRRIKLVDSIFNINTST